MRIQIFSSYARQTGSWVRLYHLAEALRRHARVELVVPLPRCLPLRLDIALSLPWYLLRALFSRADVLIAGKPFPNTALPLLLARLLRGVPIVVDIDDQDDGYLSGLPARILAAVQQPFARRFDLVTYHHDGLRPFIRRRFGVASERLYQLAQGVDLDLFSPSLDPPSLDSAPPEPASPDPIGGRDLFFMGHLDVASSLGTILEAVAIVQRDRDVELIVVGGGRLQAAFRARARALGLRVQFTGWLPVDRVARAVDQAGVCLVYHDETEANALRCSMKLREYLARGKRVVANDHGELADFDRFTYPSSGGIDDYARAICAALDGGDGREREAARHVRETSDWAVIAARFHQRLKQLSRPGKDAS